MTTLVLEKPNFLGRLVLSKFFWLAFCSFLFAYPIYRSMNRVLPPEPPVYSQLPAYVLTDELGQPFGSDQLKGKAYIASFLFSSCPTSCPELLKKLQKVQKRVRGLRDKIALVSYTVDPENDTPDVLHKLSRDYDANPRIWKFLTGSRSELTELLVKGFKVPLGDQEQTEDPSLYDIAHSNRFVLVDSEGRIRGYYSTDKISLDQLMIDVGLMVNRETMVKEKKNVRSTSQS